MNVEIKLLNPTAKLPTYGTEGAAGLDVYALIPPDRTFTSIPAGGSRVISTGVAVSVNDPDWALMLMPRSGLAKKGIVLKNAIGLIDSDYQGELLVMLENRGTEDFHIEQYDRIAQAVLVRVQQVQFDVVKEFTARSARGIGGFGSTGVAYSPATKPDASFQRGSINDDVLTIRA